MKIQLTLMEKVLVGGVALLILVWAGLGLYGHHAQKVAAAKAEERTVWEKRSSDAENQAKIEKARQQVQAQAITDREASIAVLKAKLAKLQAGAVPSPGVHPDVPPVEPGVQPGVDGGDLCQGVVIETQREIIQEQDKLIAQFKTQVGTATARGDALEVALENERKARACDRIAQEAQTSAIKSARWSGRLEGGGAGALLGLLSHLIH